MDQAFVKDTRVPVSVVKIGPCVVTQIKMQEKDGYSSIQIGFGDRNINKFTKPMQGHLKGALKEDKAPNFLKEVRTSGEEEFKIGDLITTSQVFEEGDIISVTGVSKGKGFAGGVKRWGFAGGPKTHGQSDRHRAPGSIGQGTSPGRVHKGKKMAGRMGGEQKTIKNLKVVGIDLEKGTMMISGPIPGSFGTRLVFKRLNERKETSENE